MWEKDPERFIWNKEELIGMNADDWRHIKELSKHIGKLKHYLEDYRANHCNPHKIGVAYHKICEDMRSDNRCERELASFIVDKFQKLELKAGGARPHTADSFLKAYYAGKIKDPKMIEKGMEGLCSNAGLMILSLCNTDSIERLYKQK